MNHRDYLVDLVDPQGRPVSTKQRGEIDKVRDSYHRVYAVVIAPDGRVALATIPERQDLPNLYGSLESATVATIRRHGETAYGAVVRAVDRELHVTRAEPELIGEGPAVLDGDRVVYMSVYVVRAKIPDDYSQAEVGTIRHVRVEDFEQLMRDHPEKLAPTMRAIWMAYGSAITQASR